MNPTGVPHLLHFRISHYNEKVRWALDHKGWAHTREALVPGLHIPRVRWLSGQNQVPVLVLDGRVLKGSAQILEEIERLRPEPPLFPADPALRQRALGIQKFFDDEVAPAVRTLFWSAYFNRGDDAARMAADGFPDGVRRVWRLLFPLLKPVFRGNLRLHARGLADARARLAGFYDRLASEIQPSGYLVGNSFSVADLSAAAVMTALIRPPQFPYPLPEPWPPALAALRAQFAEHPAHRWVLDIYARHRSPSAEVPRE